MFLVPLERELNTLQATKKSKLPTIWFRIYNRLSAENHIFWNIVEYLNLPNGTNNMKKWPLLHELLGTEVTDLTYIHLKILRHSFGGKRVKANDVYQEYVWTLKDFNKKIFLILDKRQRAYSYEFHCLAYTYRICRLFRKIWKM